MKDRAGLQTLALVAQLGFSIACPMVVFIGGGAWLDGQLGTVPWLLFAGIALGLLAAGAALYQVTKVPVSRRTGSGEAPKRGSTGGIGKGTVRADAPEDFREDE
jgi:F0F1-type ATP synthase assembly protein I